jgi:hypothetical protein
MVWIFEVVGQKFNLGRICIQVGSWIIFLHTYSCFLEYNLYIKCITVPNMEEQCQSAFKIFRRRRQGSRVKLDYDSLLKLEMSSVLYVHTQRFVAEIQAFCHHFSQLQSFLNSVRSAAAGTVVCSKCCRWEMYKFLSLEVLLTWAAFPLISC